MTRAKFLNVLAIWCPVAALVAVCACGQNVNALPPNGPHCIPVAVAAPNLRALRADHPLSANAAGTLALDSQPIRKLLTSWADPGAFAAQATPRQLASYGFVGEPMVDNTGPGPQSIDQPEDILVFHGNWSADQVNMHGVGLGAHVRWMFVDAVTGQSFGGGYADCSTE